MGRRWRRRARHSAMGLGTGIRRGGRRGGSFGRRMWWPTSQNFPSRLSKKGALLTLEESACGMSHVGKGGRWCGWEECHELMPSWGCRILARTSAGIMGDVDISEDVLFWKGTVGSGSRGAGGGRRGVRVGHRMEMEGRHGG